MLFLRGGCFLLHVNHLSRHFYTQAALCHFCTQAAVVSFLHTRGCAVIIFYKQAVLVSFLCTGYCGVISTHMLLLCHFYTQAAVCHVFTHTAQSGIISTRKLL